MTTLADRPNAALLLIDVQSGVLRATHGRDAVVATVATFVEKARRERAPFIWLQHSDEQLVKGRADRRVHSLHTPRRVRQGVRRDPRRRCPHHRGPDGLGSSAAGPGHRAHEPVLGLPDGAGADRRDGRDEGYRLQRHILGSERARRLGACRRGWRAQLPAAGDPRNTSHPCPATISSESRAASTSMAKKSCFGLPGT